MSDETVDSSVRVRAVEALGKFGDARLLPDLESIVQQDADEKFGERRKRRWSGFGSDY